MLYKTIVLELLEQNPMLHEQLRKDRKLLAALNHYSMQLKKNHRAWKDRLSQAKPQSDENLNSSQALEIATKELEDLLSAFPRDEDAPISLEQAMAYIRKHTPPAWNRRATNGTFTSTPLTCSTRPTIPLQRHPPPK